MEALGIVIVALGILTLAIITAVAVACMMRGFFEIFLKK